MAREKVPPSSHRVADTTSGKMDFEWYKTQQRQARLAAETTTSVETAETNIATLATASHCALIEAADDKDYIIWLRTPFAGSITRTTVKSSTGTCTLTVKVNTTAVGGSAHSVSSTEESIARSTTNTFAAGDDFRITIASNSAAEDVSVSIDYTRSDVT
jgi:hypothetical protein